tara:strand:- start:3425 stop:4192 length:768 start_codon:yes stop_codon:yes gene_type:complete
MKVVILAGGLGTRLSEETNSIPKPMVEIGQIPMLIHIMRHYYHFGFKEFVILLGYKGNLIKEYFLNYPHNSKEFSIDFKNGKKELINDTSEDWKISFLDTGESTMTGGRIKRAENIIGNEDFMLTYGDGLSNVNLKALQDFHKSHGKTATMTSVLPTERFGVFTSENDKVTSFVEKPNDSNSWINGGFFIFTNSIFDYLNSDNTSLEKEPLQSLANEGELMTFRHKEFWKCMDTLKDKNELQALWESGNPPWKIR